MRVSSRPVTVEAMTERTACQSPNPQSLTDPGQLIANLPAILGFFPRESIVLATFESVTGSTYSLGPILRLDIGTTEGVRDLFRGGGTIADCDLVCAFVISEEVLGGPHHSPRLLESLRLIEDAVADSTATLAGIWGCEEVLTGSRYVSLRPAAGECAIPGWAGGTVSSVVGSAAMEQWVAAGKLPEVSREDVFSRFTRGNPFLSASELARIGERAGVGTQRWSGGIGLVEELGAMIADAEGLDEEVLLADEELLDVCAAVLGETQLRDAAVGDVLGMPGAAGPVMLAAAKSLRGNARANALCLYALAVIAEEFPMAANPALITALAEVPRHSLSRLILHLLHTGDLDSLLESVSRGSEVARRGLAER